MEKTVKINPYPVRMPQELREWYVSRAKENSRSLNGEVVNALKEVMSKAMGQKVNG